MKGLTRTIPVEESGKPKGLRMSFLVLKGSENRYSHTFFFRKRERIVARLREYN